MEQRLLKPEFEFILLVAAGIILFWLLRLLTRALQLVPLKPSHKKLLQRAQPLITAVLGIAYVAFVLRVLLRSEAAAQPLTLAAILLAVAAAAWFGVRDFVAGVALKLGRACEPGDRVRIGEIEGIVERLGVRSLTIETRQGEEALIPYSRITSAAIVRTSLVDGIARHVFELQAKDGSTPAEVRQLVAERAMTAHFASPAREPHIKPLGEQRYEVTVFAFHGDYGPDIEAAVRKGQLFIK